MDAILKQLIDIFLTSVAGLSGIRAYLARKALEYGGQILLDWYNSIVKKFKRKSEQEKAVERLEKIDKDPKSSVEDEGKAYEEMFNSGK
jgi:hypothetical protein